MTLRILLAALTVLVPPTTLAAAPVDTYRLSPVVESGKVTALSVTLTLPADADGETRLALPNAWGGGEKLWRLVKDFTVEGGTVSAPSDDIRVIASKSRAPLTIRYRVVGAYEGEPPVDSPGYAQPIGGPDGFYVVGHTIFATPEGRDDDAVRFVWDPGGSALRFASDLEHLRETPGTVADLADSVAIAYPDLRVLERPAAGAPLRVAVRGAFPFSDEAFADTAAEAIGAARTFWGDGREPFLITLASLNGPPGWRSRRGSGLGDAFALIATREGSLDEYRLFLAHEYFHSWNSKRIGGLKTGPDEPLGYWFSEGFTDYYARRLMLRAGHVDLEAFAEAWNTVLEAYALSPARAAPNAEIAARFWRDGAMQKLPYHRGALIALLMENRLKASGGLDPVMLAMRDHADGKDDRSEWGETAAALFPRVVLQKIGIDVTADLARHAERGEPITLPADAFGGCLTVETIARPIYRLGFDGAATGKSKIITGVDPEGPAYAAALRDGMTYLGRTTGKPGDGSVETGFMIEDAASKREIRYLPAGKTKVEIQRIVVPASLEPEARAACVKAVAG